MRVRAAGVAFVLGVLVGLAASAGASRPTVAPETSATISGDGYLVGWTVTFEGDEVCSYAYAWQATHEIECEP